MHLARGRPAQAWKKKQRETAARGTWRARSIASTGAGAHAKRTHAVLHAIDCGQLAASKNPAAHAGRD
jgi:hypothetical protein